MQLFTLTSPELPDREMANQNSVYDIDTDWLYIFPNSYWKVRCFGVNPSEKNWKRNWREGKTQLSIFKIAPSYIGSLICCQDRRLDWRWAKTNMFELSGIWKRSGITAINVVARTNVRLPDVETNLVADIMSKLLIWL